MYDYEPSKYDYLYENEAWAELAKEAGIAPGNTESQARIIAGLAAEKISELQKKLAEKKG